MDDPAKPAVWDRRALVAWAADDFARRGIAAARLDAELLLAHALACRRVDLYLRHDHCPEPDELDRFRELVRRRRGREPVALILGTQPFHDIVLTVEPGVFIPRPETELLVDEALTRLRGRDHRQTAVLDTEHTAVLDLCAGTGALALAIAHAVPGLAVQAVELDTKALELARQNARNLALDNRVTFLAGDLFEPLAGPQTFDLIASNPPYVPRAEIPGLMPEVRNHDPALALDGGPDGLDLVRRILSEAPAHLRPGGHLIIEIGERQEQPVIQLAPPSLSHQSTRRDLAGCPRIITFKKAG